MTDDAIVEPLVLDFSKICRACKSQDGAMHELYKGLESDPDCPRIDEMLMACTSLQVNSDDGLPTTICDRCLQSLKLCFDFKLQCERIDSELRDVAEHLKQSEEADLQAKLSELQEMIDYNMAKSEVQIKTEESLVQGSDGSVERCDFIEILDGNQMILTCKQCYKVFTTVDGLKCHKRVHSGSLFKCKLCDKEYTRMNHLQRHELSHGKRKMHVCKICKKTLTRFEHLKRHLVTHLKEKPYSCEKCNRGFNRSEHLMNHAMRCKGDRIHICDICNKGFNRADSLEVHRRIHDDKAPVLPTLENLDNIDEHYIEIDVDDMYTPGYDDEDDDAGFDLDETDCFEPQVDITVNEPLENIEDKIESGGEEVDMKSNHEDEDEAEALMEESQDLVDYNENNSDSGDSEYTPTKLITKMSPKVKRGRGRPRKNVFGRGGRRGRPPVKRKFEIKQEEDELDEITCPICNDKFDNISLLEKHAAEHDDAKVLECKTCSRLFSRATHLKRHEATHSTDRPHSCDFCTKSFCRRDHLTQHMKLHSRAQEFECDICKRLFSRADHLAKHKQAKHSEGDRMRAEKKYKCTVCTKSFTTEKYRDVHMKWHTGEKKFQCKTCDKLFLSKSHLTEHMKFHNDNSKKFLCSECGQRFIRNDYLVIHMRRHRGEKPFKCKFCGKGFPRTTDLTVHERYHTGEKTHLCVICGRGFGRAYNLTVHMRTHTGEKPYQCTYCDAAFAQGNDLKAHVRRHTGERFACDLCPETFIMGYLLTQHKRTIHGLNVVSNIRRLQPVCPKNEDDPPPITITLPAPVVPSTILNAQLHAQIQLAQIQHHMVNE